ncbi:hypothetical protein [Humisphaera borealis]|uniref:Uncharacterized protein n=1 Tax=Humisphaera borealis TaxID=2807512 RepID=A0A7M2X1U1_9BACT|nr:hypothetical protein [Humisphaera borealis]QOV91634.1 hypothetical protein IPV69_09830 [Humisphaera borealis]
MRAEVLEVRSLLSVSIDLSLQGAIWAGSAIKASTSPATVATVVPFRIDAVRVAGPVVTVGRIDDVPLQPSRIDGVFPVGSPVGTVGGPDVLTFAQIDPASVFQTRPFERDPSGLPEDKHDKADGEGSAAKPFEKPPTDIDWSCFEIFKDVAFTYSGGTIEADLPIDGAIVPVNIVIGQFPQGSFRPDGAAGGVGSFFARIAAFGLVATPPGSSQGVLEIPSEPTMPGGGATVPPAGSVGSGVLVVPPATPQQGGTAGRPSPRPEGAGGPVVVNRPGDAPALSDAARLSLHAAATATGTVAYADRHAFSQFESHGLQFVSVPKSAAATGVGGPILTDPQRPTTLLLDQSEAQAGHGAGEMARYLVMVAGTQLSSLSEAALRLFGSGEGSPPAGPTIIDLDAIRSGAGSAVALGLSPWHMSASPAQDVATAWKVTAGISLVVAIGGYWYCKEFTARRRQEQLLESRFIAGVPGSKGRSSTSPERGAAESNRPSPFATRNLIGQISRIWRDEVTY